VICPACGYDNIEGVDACENCGADLRTVDIPAAAAGLAQPSPFARHMQASLAALAPPPAEVVSPETDAAVALARMRGAATDCLLVARAGRVVGVFTERDAVLKLAGRPLEGVTVGQVMTADPVVLRPDDTVAVAVHKMAVGGFRHIPIVDPAGHGVGVISAADVFRHVLAAG
jgi:CBS domain-containing protein